MLPQVLDKDFSKQVVAMTIFLGANDSNDARNVVQHVPLEEYKEYTKDIINLALVCCSSLLKIFSNSSRTIAESLTMISIQNGYILLCKKY